MQQKNFRWVSGDGLVVGNACVFYYPRWSSISWGPGSSPHHLNSNTNEKQHELWKAKDLEQGLRAEYCMWYFSVCVEWGEIEIGKNRGRL